MLREPFFPEPPGGGNPGDCLVCMCFYWVWVPCGVPPDQPPAGDPVEPGEVPDEPTDPDQGPCGYRRLVIELTDSRSCNTSQVGFACTGPGYCMMPKLPCLDLDADGICSWTDDDPEDDVDEAIEKVIGDNVDPTALEYWNLFRDADGDGLPNILDHDFEINGPKFNADGELNPDYVPFNPLAPIPPDADMVDEIFAEAGFFLPAGLKPSDLLPGDTAEWDLNGGDLTLGDLVPHLVSGLVAIKDARISDLVAAAVGFFTSGVALSTDLHSAYHAAIIDELEALVQAAFDLESFLYYLGPGYAGGLDEYFAISEKIDSIIEPIDGLIAEHYRILTDIVESPQYQRMLKALESINEASKQALVGKFGEAEVASRVTAALAIRVVFTNGTPLLKPVIVWSDGSVYEVDDPSTSPTSKEIETSRGDPVSTSTGAFQYENIDFALDGRGVNLELKRVYDSRDLHLGATGRNFSMPLVETRLQIIPGLDWRMLILHWGDGRISHFVLDEDPDSNESFYQGILGEYGKIRIARGDGGDEPGCSSPVFGFILREPSGLQWYFCPPAVELGAGGYLTCWLRKVSDLQGNALVIQRDGFARCTHIIDTLYRTTQFTYLNDHERIISKITRPDGGEIRYTYDLTKSNSGVTSYDLVRVDFPETLYITESREVASGRGWLDYEYWQHPDGFVVDPSGVMNHNLKSVTSPTGVVVEVQYYFDPDGYSHDRVQSVTVDGRTTSFLWQELDDSNPDAYGQKAAHLCRVLLPDGELEAYYHDSGSRLLRREVSAFRDDDGDFVPDGSDPAGVNAYLTLYEYEDTDNRVLSRTTTTDLDFVGGPRRRTEWDYNSAASDRFQQGLILEVRNFAATMSEGEAPVRVESHVYDPITVATRTTVDALGRVVDRTFTHQEAPLSVAAGAFGVRDWGIDLGSTGWNVGDVNGDGMTGTFTSLGGFVTGVFDAASISYPELDVPPATGPGSPTTTTPQELRAYNPYGQRTDVRSPAGLWTRYQYVGGRLSAVTSDTTDVPPVTQTFEYDSWGNLTRTTTAGGRVTEYTYDGWDHIISEAEYPRVAPGEDPTEKVVRDFFFDLAGDRRGTSVPHLELATSDPYSTGHVPVLASWSDYRPNHSVSSLERWSHFEGQASVATTQYEYDGQEREFRVVRPDGSTRHLLRDTRGLPVEAIETGTDGVTTAVRSFEYDSLGNPTAAVASVDSDGDGNRDRTTQTPNGYGEIVRTISPIGVRSESTLDDAGRPVRTLVYDSQDVVVSDTTQEYDALDRVTRTVVQNLLIDPLGNVYPGAPAQFVVEQGWGLGDDQLNWSCVDPAGAARITRHEYDSLGRRTVTWKGATDEVGESFEYDSEGRPTRRVTQYDSSGRTGSENPSTSSVTYAYDAYGRLGAEQVGAGPPTTYEYDASGNRIAETDPTGLRIEYDCDSNGLCFRERDAAGTGVERIAQYSFDVMDRLTSITNGNGIATTFAYDALGRLAERGYADGHIVTYVNDSRGRVTSIVEPGQGGTSTAIIYDAADRPTEIAATGADADVSRTHAYDALGRMTVASERVGSGDPITVFRAHDSSDHVVAERQLIGALVDRLALASYDSTGLLEDVLYPTGWVARRSRDSIGRLSAIVRDPGGIAKTVAQ
ncbi:MAG: RHS repeat protein, partial [Planctomycetes bacterium]|nr:RHS repeat protein [Planctomycetota bacterium]